MKRKIGLLLFILFVSISSSLAFIEPTPMNGETIANDQWSYAFEKTLEESFSVADVNGDVLLYLPMDEVDENNAPVDYSIYNRTQFINNNITYPEGYYGDGADICASSTCWIRINESIGQINGSFSVSLWINADAIGGQQDILSTQSNPGIDDMGIYLSGDAPRFYAGNNTISELTSSNRKVTAGEWFHLVGVLDTSVPIVQIWVNGRLGQEDGATAPTSGPNLAGKNIQIGRIDNGARDYTGLVDEVLIVQRALTEEEINGLYNRGRSPSFRTFTESSGDYTVAGFSKESRSQSQPTVHQTRNFTIDTSGDINLLYPQDFVTVQRNGNGGVGNIPIYGTYSGSPTAIQARFKGGTWTNIDLAPTGGTFSGTLVAGPGQGAVEVRFSNDNEVTDSSVFVGVGEVFVTAGQSNSRGPFTFLIEWQNESNPYYNTMYRFDDTWMNLNDPTNSAGGGSGGAFWIHTSDLIAQKTGVPVGLITTSQDGSFIETWRQDGSNFIRAVGQLYNATNGTKANRALLYYQGESDTNSVAWGNGSEYYNSGINMTNAWVDETTFATAVAFGMTHAVTDPDRTRESHDNITLAQQALWRQDSAYSLANGLTGLDALDSGITICQGGIMSNLKTEEDGVHIRDLVQKKPMGLFYGYGVLDCLFDYSAGEAPRVTALNYLNTQQTLRLTFNRDVTIKDFNGTVYNTIRGFYLNGPNQTLTDDNVQSVSVSGVYADVTFDTQIVNTTKVWYGSWNDTEGIQAFASTDESNQPALKIYGESINGFFVIPPDSISTQALDSCYAGLSNYADVMGYTPLIIFSLIVVVIIMAILGFSAISQQNNQQYIGGAQDMSGIMVAITLGAGVIVIVGILIFAIGSRVTVLFC